MTGALIPARKYKKCIIISLALFITTIFIFADNGIAININDVPTALTFGMPIGFNSRANLSELSFDSWDEFSYPKIRFNDNGDDNREINEWYIAVAFNNNRWLNNGWNSEPSPADNDVLCSNPATRHLSSLYTCDGVYHPGEDWNANKGNGDWPDDGDRGAPLYSIANGVVIYKGDNTGWGNTAIIVHRTATGDYITSFYSHMVSPTTFNVGDYVRQGTQIGEVGNTETVYPHLHFEIRKQTNTTLTISNNEISLPAGMATYWPQTENLINQNYYSPSQLIYQHRNYPLAGDFNGNGFSDTGTYSNNTFDINNQIIPFGMEGDIPIIGDWDGNSTDDIGVFRPKENSGNNSTFYLDINNDGIADRSIDFNYYPHNIPVVGDWDGNGQDDICGFDPTTRTFYLYILNNSTTAVLYETVNFGNTGDFPIAGDWDGDGDDDIGVFRPGTTNTDSNAFYLDFNLTGGVAEDAVIYGISGDRPVIGVWNGDGIDNIGVYRPSTEEFVLYLEPTYCHQYTSSSVIPIGYGAPYNVLSEDQEMLIKIACNTDSVDVEVGNGDPMMYIYRMGYIYKDNQWQSYELTGPHQITADWYAKNASANIPMTSAELSGSNYLVAYTCYWNGSSWQCGCRDENCSQNYWQLQLFGASGYPATVIDTISVGNSPRYIAVTPDGSYLYVSNFDNDLSVVIDTVSVIRTSDNTVIDTIPVGDRPNGVAVTPNGSYVYVTHWSSDGTVSVIRTSDNTVIDTIPVGGGPQGVAMTPDGLYAYVTSEYDHTVSVIRTSDNTVIEAISVGYSPHGVVITPDGRYGYVTQSDSTVSVIRTSDNTVIDTIPVGDRPKGVAVTPNGSYVYVTNGYDDTVSVIRTSDNTVINTIPVGGFPNDVAVTPNGSYVYVPNDSDSTISVIRTSDNTVIDTIPVNRWPRGVAVAPNGSYVYVTTSNSDTVSVIGF